MKNKIITKNGVYSYLPIHLYLGRKLINRDVCKQNLLDFKRILDNEKIQFGIMFGTLLGAVREQNFIEHDEDTDVYVLAEYRENILSLLFKFKDNGFEVARYDESLLTIIRNNDYIDIYFFKKKFFKKRVCMQYGYDSNFFNKFEQIPFLDTTFNAPNNYLLLLEELYGKDWMIPKKNAHAECTPLLSIKEKIIGIIKSGVISNIYPYNYRFSKQFNMLHQQIKSLEKQEKYYLIYGAGKISDLIYTQIENNIVTRVDQKSNLIARDFQKEKIYSLNSIPLIKYDQIIVSVLGREKEIIKYLTSELHIPRDKIITFNLKAK